MSNVKGGESREDIVGLSGQSDSRSKIVCTIGPASDQPAVLRGMIEAGMDVARINLSHGTLESHEKTVRSIRAIGGASVLIDLPGPKIRLGDVKGTVLLRIGREVHFTSEETLGTATELPIAYKNLPREVRIGGSLFINDGLVEAKIISIDEDLKGFTGRIVSEGEVSSRKGVNIPGAELSIRPPVESDVRGIRFGVEVNADWFAASFVRTREDVENVRNAVIEVGGKQPIVSKIEQVKAVENIDDIIDASDGVMVARGDLGIELPPWHVPILQKQIISKCNRSGKPVIVATQMLESMVGNPRPTRAEASDVANAILDGADAVMLSEETAVGKYPIVAVRLMNRISLEAENQMPRGWIDSPEEQAPIPDLIGSLVSRAAVVLKPSAIIVMTRSGFSARMTAKHRPKAQIFAVGENQAVNRQMRLYWGVEPVDVEWVDDRDKLLVRVVSKIVSTGALAEDDVIMVVSRRTSTLEITTVRDILTPVEG